MTTTSTARIANDSALREAQVAMDKFIEQLMAMADQGATADAVSQLLAKDGTALLRDLRVSQGLDQNAATPVEKAAGYLVKHTRLLHYDRARADGLPIATGVIEGACRYLVQDRMGRTGARWSLVWCRGDPEPSRVADQRRLRRLLVVSSRERANERTHESRYADGAAPNPLPMKRPTLRLVK